MHPTHKDLLVSMADHVGFKNSWSGLYSRLLTFGDGFCRRKGSDRQVAHTTVSLSRLGSVLIWNSNANSKCLKTCRWLWAFRSCYSSYQWRVQTWYQSAYRLSVGVPLFWFFVAMASGNQEKQNMHHCKWRTLFLGVSCSYQRGDLHALNEI